MDKLRVYLTKFLQANSTGKLLLLINPRNACEKEARLTCLSEKLPYEHGVLEKCIVKENSSSRDSAFSILSRLLAAQPRYWGSFPCRANGFVFPASSKPCKDTFISTDVCTQYDYKLGCRDSSVGIATRYGLHGLGIESRYG
jgi:hypothetical protein